MKFVVTGGAGFIGSHIVEYLVERGDSVTVIDNLNTGKKENLQRVLNKINFVEGDIRDYDLLQGLVKNVNGIFHEAALASVQESFSKTKEYFDVNVNGTENIFKLAKIVGAKVVYASSSSVYGNPKVLPIKEDADLNPINPYAQTKLEDEYLAKKYVVKGVKIIGLRYFNVFGERQSKEYAGVIKLFLEKIANKEPPLVNGDGLQTRDFVFVGDVVKANIIAMESSIDNGFFNVGTGECISVLDLAKIMIRVSGLPLKPIHRQALEGDVRATQADIAYIKKLSWKPEIKLENWLEDKISKIELKSRTI